MGAGGLGATSAVFRLMDVGYASLWNTNGAFEVRVDCAGWIVTNTKSVTTLAVPGAFLETPLDAAQSSDNYQSAGESGAAEARIAELGAQLRHQGAALQERAPLALGRGVRPFRSRGSMAVASPLFIKLPTPTSTVTVAGCNIPQSRHIKIKSRHSEVGVRPVRQWGSGSRGRGTVAPPLFIKRPTPTATTMVGRNVPQSRHIQITISKMIIPNGTNHHLTYLRRIDRGTISRPQSRLENLPQSRVENLP